jgi:hypothetical protein
MMTRVIAPFVETPWLIVSDTYAAQFAKQLQIALTQGAAMAGPEIPPQKQDFGEQIREFGFMPAKEHGRGLELARLNRAVKEQNRRDALEPLVDVLGLALAFLLVIAFFAFLGALRGGR